MYNVWRLASRNSRLQPFPAMQGPNNPCEMWQSRNIVKHSNAEAKPLFYWLTADLKPVFLSLAKQNYRSMQSRDPRTITTHMFHVLLLIVYIYTQTYSRIYLPTVATKKTTEHLGLVSTLNIRSSKKSWGMQGFIPPSIISHHIIILVRIGHLRKKLTRPHRRWAPLRLRSVCLLVEAAKQTPGDNQGLRGHPSSLGRHPIPKNLLKCCHNRNSPINMSQPKHCEYAYILMCMYIYIYHLFSFQNIRIEYINIYYMIWNTKYNSKYNIKYYII